MIRHDPGDGRRREEYPAEGVIFWERIRQLQRSSPDSAGRAADVYHLSTTLPMLPTGDPVNICKAIGGGPVRNIAQCERRSGVRGTSCYCR
jgi:hypothetical protein